MLKLFSFKLNKQIHFMCLKKYTSEALALQDSNRNANVYCNQNKLLYIKIRDRA